MSGADGFLRTLKSQDRAPIVVSDFIRQGLHRVNSGDGPKPMHFPGAAQAVSFAMGLSMTGKTSGVLLDTSQIGGVNHLLASACQRQLPVTIVIASGEASDLDPLSEFSGLECPILVASHAQSLLDLSVIADHVARTALIPVIILTRSREALWSHELLETGPFNADFETSGRHDFYSAELFGESAGNNPAWMDTANPMASGSEMKDTLKIKRQIGRQLFIREKLVDLIDDAMERFAQASGRLCSAVHASIEFESKASLLFIGTPENPERHIENGNRKNSLSVVHLTRLNPFPREDLAAALSSTERVGVVAAFFHNDSFLLSEVRSVLAESVRSKKRGIWSLKSDESVDPNRVVSISAPPFWNPTETEFRTLAEYMLQEELPLHPIAVGFPSSPEAARLPEIEARTQKMVHNGLVTSKYFLSGLPEKASPHGTTSDTEVVVVSSSARSAWTQMERVCRVMKLSGAARIRGSIHPASSASSHPVICRISSETQRGHPSIVLVDEPHLLYDKTIRETVPPGSLVLAPEASGSQYPYWMVDADLNVQSIESNESGLSGSESLLGALVRSHSLFAGLDGHVLFEEDVFSVDSAETLSAALDTLVGGMTELDSGAFASPSDAPPELVLAESTLDAAGGNTPIADRSRHWKSAGHLHRFAGTDDIPVDAFLTSGYLPASTASFPSTPVPNQILPRVITENCTGCGSCFASCPESALVARAYTVESLLSGQLERSSRPMVHLPRVLPAVIKTTHKLLSQDELHQYSTIGDLFEESLTRVMDAAGLEGKKRDELMGESDLFIADVASIRPIRSDIWFDEAEEIKRGTGSILSIDVDPNACTSCGICVSSCGDNALEMLTGGDRTIESRQVRALPSSRVEMEASTRLDHPASILLGGSSDRVFRSGSSDVGNLNRTTLRLFLEAQNEQAAAVRARILDALDAIITRIDERLQLTVHESVQINDFERFAQELHDASREVDESLALALGPKPSSLAERLSTLSEYHKSLTAERLKFGAIESASHQPHMILIDSTMNRDLGLARYPSNPFSMPYYKASSEDVSGLLSGIAEGFLHQYMGLAARIRTAAHVLEDVVESDPSNGSGEEDRSWAYSALPRMMLVTDTVSESLIDLLNSGLRVDVLLLSGGISPRNQLPRIDLLSGALSSSNIVQQTVSNPVGFLASCREVLSGDASTLFHVYAPDSIRDGIAPERALKLAALAEQCGLFSSWKKTPGEDITPSGMAKSSDSTIALWLLEQDRFSFMFEAISGKNWSSDQIPISDWLNLSSDERSRVEPVVERVDDSGQSIRYRLVSEAIDLATQGLNLPLFEEKASNLQASPSAESSAEQKTRSIPPSSTSDALSTLTRRLLAMSGLSSGNVSVAEWLKNQSEEATS